VVFQTTPRRFFTIHEVRLEPNTFGLRIAMPEGARIDRERAYDTALDARRRLQERGFPNAQVSYELSPAGRGEVDLKLKIDPGDAVHVGAVEFGGDSAIPPAELQHALWALRSRRILPGIPHLWNGWVLLPSFATSAVDSDIARLRSYYFFKGYFDSDVRSTEEYTGGISARVTIEVHAGAKHAAVPRDFCSTLFAERRAAERRGLLDFSVTADVDSAGQLTWSTEPGQQYRVGRIQFAGNRHYSDAFVRRNFIMDEGEPFDDQRLRKSLARLNRTNLFESIDDHSIGILRNAETATADVDIRLTERKRGSWNISGPVGPASFAGPLQASIGTHLPRWGRGILELSTYTASYSVFAFASPLIPALKVATNKLWIPVLSLQRPYTPGEGWRSGFAIAPQLGWRFMAAGYVATQIEQHLLPALNGDRGLVPELPVTVHRPSGDTMVVCEPPAPKLSALRSATGMALHALGALSGL
jgi:Surface antigen variable number repeat